MRAVRGIAISIIFQGTDDLPEPGAYHRQPDRRITGVHEKRISRSAARDRAVADVGDSRPDIGNPMQPILLQGEIPDASARPAGCPFHPRCGYAVDTCRMTEPRLEALGAEQHQVACMLAADLRAERVSQAKAD